MTTSITPPVVTPPVVADPTSPGGGPSASAGVAVPVVGSEEEELLRPPGVRALEAMKEERRALKETLQPWQDLGVTPDEVRTLLAAREGEQERQHAREVERAAIARANERLIAAEVRAAAKGVLTDPADAHKFLDLQRIEVGDDGVVDVAAIEAAIADLVKAKPYLGVQDPARFQGGADQGPRQQEQASLETRIAEAQARGDMRAAISLQNSKLPFGG